MIFLTEKIEEIMLKGFISDSFMINDAGFILVSDISSDINGIPMGYHLISMPFTV
jgi:hypothetical protein